MPLFISLEGGEGCGKSTQAEILARRLKQAGLRPVLVHEPGTTPLGWYLREWLKRQRRKKEETISHGAELFLFAAARSELVAKVIRPELERGNTVVIADRYADSTTAYQGYGRRLPQREINLLNGLATDGVMPDLTFLLDCSPLEGLKRVGSVQTRLPLDSGEATVASRMDEEGTRRFEEESLEFHERVRAGYLEIADRDPERWRVIDATRPIEEVGHAVWKHVRHKLAQNSAGRADDSAELELESPAMENPG